MGAETPGETTVGGVETTAAPTTTEGVTTPYVTTVVPYPGLTVNECIGECEALGFMYAALLNGSYCICHNAMNDLDLEYDDGTNCNIECTGGNDDGGSLMCGGMGFLSVFQTQLYGI